MGWWSVDAHRTRVEQRNEVVRVIMKPESQRVRRRCRSCVREKATTTSAATDLWVHPVAMTTMTPSIAGVSLRLRRRRLVRMTSPEFMPSDSGGQLYRGNFLALREAPFKALPIHYGSFHSAYEFTYMNLHANLHNTFLTTAGYNV